MSEKKDHGCNNSQTISYLYFVWLKIKINNMCIDSYTGGSFYGKPISARECIHLGTSQVSGYYD